MSYDRAVTHMNSDHADALLAIVQAHGGEPGAAVATIVAMDDDGMDVDVRVSGQQARQIRIAFDPPISPDTVRERMAGMARQARAQLGDR